MASFFRFEKVDARDLPEQSELMPALRQGDLHAVLVSNVYDAVTVQAAVTALEANAPGFIESSFPAAFRAGFYGLNLNLADPDLTPYFQAEPAFRKALSGLVAPDFERRVTSVLSRLDDNHTYCAAPGPTPGSRHFFTTIRSHGTGGFIPEHFDNESTVRPSFRHLRPLIRPDIYSFVLAFSRAESGGALEFFTLKAEDHAAQFRNIDGPAPNPSVEGLERVSVRLAPGDMIILNSGGFLHRVTPVEGERTRWTACSFMAPARAGSQIYCWG